ncbi:MAG: ECF-type sigma factor [Bryobacteraceae bacterium]|jgi:RNA polymerase sigma factor (TIGR02999 family)
MLPDSQIPGEITSLLQRWSGGDAGALDDLVEVAYRELHAIAEGYLRQGSRSQTLQATELVSELYLRLARQRTSQLSDRAHFYTFAAMLMRRILSDHGRRARAQKRPSADAQIPLHPDLAWIDASGEEMLSLDQALAELEFQDPRKVRIIELRYFLGCTNEETAELLGVTRSTVDRDLQFARAWLYRRLHSAS